MFGEKIAIENWCYKKGNIIKVVNNIVFVGREKMANERTQKSTPGFVVVLLFWNKKKTIINML